MRTSKRLSAPSSGRPSRARRPHGSHSGDGGEIASRRLESQTFQPIGVDIGGIEIANPCFSSGRDWRCALKLGEDTADARLSRIRAKRRTRSCCGPGNLRRVEPGAVDVRKKSSPGFTRHPCRQIDHPVPSTALAPRALPIGRRTARLKPASDNPEPRSDPSHALVPRSAAESHPTATKPSATRRRNASYRNSGRAAPSGAEGEAVDSVMPAGRRNAADMATHATDVVASSARGRHTRQMCHHPARGKSEDRPREERRHRRISPACICAVIQPAVEDAMAAPIRPETAPDAPTTCSTAPK